MKSRILVASFALVSMALVAGCQENCKKADPATAAAPASMGVMNSKCPLMPEHAIDKDVTVAYQEGKVGFCCKGCVGKWNALTDAQKAEKLAKAK